MKLLVSFTCFTALLAHLHISQVQDTPGNWLELHNLVRAEVGVGPLKWNTALENYAKKYSEQRSGDCELTHSHGPYGENIYWGQGDGYTDAVAAMRAWVDEEIGCYNYSSNACLYGKQCLHYTQIIWKKSVQLGCAMAKCSDAVNKVFITCNYYPPGNYYGQRPY